MRASFLTLSALAILLLALAQPALADVIVSPASITERICEEKTIPVRIQNTFGHNVSVTISKTGIAADINPLTLTIPPNSHRNVSVKRYPEPSSGNQ